MELRQIECTINGLGERAGNTALRRSSNGFETAQRFDLYTDINSENVETK